MCTGQSPGSRPLWDRPSHMRGLRQGEPKILAGPEGAKPYDQDKPTRAAPRRLCVCQGWCGPHLLKGGRCQDQTPGIMDLSSEAPNCLKEEANNALDSQRSSLDCWGLRVLLKTMLIRGALLYTVAKSPMC